MASNPRRVSKSLYRFTLFYMAKGRPGKSKEQTHSSPKNTTLLSGLRPSWTKSVTSLIAMLPVPRMIWCNTVLSATARVSMLASAMS